MRRDVGISGTELSAEGRGGKLCVGHSEWWLDWASALCSARISSTSHSREWRLVCSLASALLSLVWSDLCWYGTIWMHV